MKKSLFLLVMCCIFVVPVLADSFVIGNLEYTIRKTGENGTLGEVSVKSAITPHYNVTGDLIIPESVPDNNGVQYTVTEIDTAGFNGVKITKLVIPSSVTRIDSAAFRDITTEFEVEFNEGLQVIENRAFCRSTGLTGLVTIPSTVTLIEEYAFGFTSIAAMDVHAETPPMLESNVFASVYVLASIPCGTGELYAATLWNGHVLDECDENTFVVNSIQYEKVDYEGATEVQVISFSGTLPSDLEIPATVTQTRKDGTVLGTYPVTSIDDGVFSGNTTITSVSISSNVRRIGVKAFYDCANLKTLTIEGNALTYIGSHAFCWSGLEGEVTLPSSVDTIGPYAFTGTSLSRLELQSVTPPVLGNLSAFYTGTRNGEITTPIVDNIIVPCEAARAYRCAYNWKDLKSPCISDCEAEVKGVLYKASSATTAMVTGYTIRLDADVTFERMVTIQGQELSVTAIADSAFCPYPSKPALPAFTSLTIPGCIEKIANNAFREINTPFTLTIEEGVKTIGDRAFCRAMLTGTVVLPTTLDLIEDYAFAYSSLASMKLQTNTPPTLGGTSIFLDVQIEVHIPCNSYEAYATTGWQKYVSDPCNTDEFVVGGIKYKKYENGDVTEVHVNGTFGEYAADLVIPATVEQTIEDEDRKTYTFTYPVTEVNDSVFMNNTHIISLVIPSSVRKIGTRSCYQLTNMENLTFEDGGSLEIGNRAFTRCTKMTQLTIPASVYRIGESAFDDWTNLTSITFEGMTPPDMENAAFNRENNIVAVHVPCGAVDAYKNKPVWNTFTPALPFAYDCPSLELREGEYLTEDMIASSMSLRRTFPMNQWVPLYLPFELDSVLVEEDGEYFDINLPYNDEDGGYFYLQEFKGIDETNQQISFANVDSIGGHTPYIIKFVNKHTDYFVGKDIIFKSVKGEYRLSSKETAEMPMAIAESAENYRIFPNQTYHMQAAPWDAYCFVANATSNGFNYRFTYTEKPDLFPFEYVLLPPEPEETETGTTTTILPKTFAMRFMGDDGDQGGNVTTAICNDPAADNITILRTGNCVTLYTTGAPCKVYSVDGTLLYADQSGKTEITLELTPGMYIVYCEGNSHKILL